MRVRLLGQVNDGLARSDSLEGNREFKEIRLQNAVGDLEGDQHLLASAGGQDLANELSEADRINLFMCDFVGQDGQDLIYDSDALFAGLVTNDLSIESEHFA